MFPPFACPLLLVLACAAVASSATTHGCTTSSRPLKFIHYQPLTLGEPVQWEKDGLFQSSTFTGPDRMDTEDNDPWMSFYKEQDTRNTATDFGQEDTPLDPTLAIVVDRVGVRLNAAHLNPIVPTTLTEIRPRTRHYVLQNILTSKECHDGSGDIMLSISTLFPLDFKPSMRITNPKLSEFDVAPLLSLLEQANAWLAQVNHKFPPIDTDAPLHHCILNAAYFIRYFVKSSTRPDANRLPWWSAPGQNELNDPNADHAHRRFIALRLAALLTDYNGEGTSADIYDHIVRTLQAILPTWLILPLQTFIHSIQ